MIQLTSHMRILVVVEPVDFRKGIDGLAQLCREGLKSDPFSGIVFVFRNHSGKAVKVLVYDGQGYWLCHKRLSEGKYRWWPGGSDGSKVLEPQQLQVLLSGGDPAGAKAAPVWRRIGVAG